MVITDFWLQGFMLGKSPLEAFYLTTHCCVSPQPVLRKENRAWGEQEFSTKWEDNFGLNLLSLDMCEKCKTALWYEGLLLVAMGIQKQKIARKIHIFPYISLTK